MCDTLPSGAEARPPVGGRWLFLPRPPLPLPDIVCEVVECVLVVRCRESLIALRECFVSVAGHGQSKPLKGTAPDRVGVGLLRNNIRRTFGFERRKRLMPRALFIVDNSSADVSGQKRLPSLRPLIQPRDAIVGGSIS